MKTTVELPDELVLEAKKRALDESTTLRALVEEGLRRRLEQGPAESDRTRKRVIRWVTAKGGAPDAVTSRERMYEWLQGK